MNHHLLLIIGLLLFCSSCSQEKSNEQRMLDDILQEGTYTIPEEAAENLDFSDFGELSELEQHLIDAGLVDIKSVLPEVYVDLKYSSEDNFFGQDVYGDLQNCYMQPEVAEMLAIAHKALKNAHPELTFLIYDAVRPLSVQQILWDNLDKPASVKPLYVADPKEGSLHNFGVAVDLTLAYQENSEALDMGTAYDYFGYPAYPDREQEMLKEGKITPKHIENRKILRAAMKAGGFSGIASEWWHFNAFSKKQAREKFEIIP
ncbi:M15 family metallopeptidase [Pararhodonellum marinum]|uniref:M15 family metallopeptidase n=1 Tax=Pararhodonellum marinum TaxID=2755358 RepID=UPI00188E6629|nr:M15 family metallopeptidase [Pararhodonellum marinum]